MGQIIMTFLCKGVWTLCCWCEGPMAGFRIEEWCDQICILWQISYQSILERRHLSKRRKGGRKHGFQAQGRPHNALVGQVECQDFGKGIIPPHSFVRRRSSAILCTAIQPMKVREVNTVGGVQVFEPTWVQSLSHPFLFALSQTPYLL
jgi:hypothetical protein